MAILYTVVYSIDLFNTIKHTNQNSITIHRKVRESHSDIASPGKLTFN